MKSLLLNGEQIEVGSARLEQIFDLRHAILRPGRHREAAMYEGDWLDSTRHYAAYGDRGAVGCATLLSSHWEDAPAYQLRGMATDPLFRGKGVGRALLEFAEADIRNTTPTRILWCNARVSAAGFYTSVGWIIRSETFDVPTVGPHYRMSRHL